jgi:hypothetical protein
MCKSTNKYNEVGPRISWPILLICILHVSVFFSLSLNGCWLESEPHPSTSVYFCSFARVSGNIVQIFVFSVGVYENSSAQTFLIRGSWLGYPICMRACNVDKLRLIWER